MVVAARSRVRDSVEDGLFVRINLTDLLLVKTFLY
jgi:hypothetical protein